MKIGTAPALMTILVCMEVPDAMFVKAQAASNCKVHTRQSGNRPVHKQNICHIPDHFLHIPVGLPLDKKKQKKLRKAKTDLGIKCMSGFWMFAFYVYSSTSNKNGLRVHREVKLSATK